MTNEILIKEFNVLNDAAFKAIMCNPNNREMVVDVIYALTGIDKKLLRNATYIGGEEIPKRNLKQKKQQTDMTIKIQKNHQIVVEMNQTESTNMFEKNTEYVFSKIVETTPSKVKRYPKIILINIDNFNKYNTEEPILEFKIQDNKGHIESELYQSIHFIIANAKNSTYNIDEELKKFARFLKQNTTVEELENEFKGDEKFMAAIRTVKDLSLDPEFSVYYDIEEAHKWDIEDAKLTGKEEGIEQANIETIKNLLNMNVLSIEQIAEATQLSVEEVKKIQSSFDNE